jgi:hypothetical protein
MKHELDEIGGHHHSGIHKTILPKIRHLYSHWENWQINLGCTFVLYFQNLEELCRGLSTGWTKLSTPRIWKWGS